MATSSRPSLGNSDMTLVDKEDPKHRSNSDNNYQDEAAAPNSTSTVPAPAPASQPQPQSLGNGPAQVSSGKPGGFSEDAYKPKTLKFWLIILSNFLALFLVALDRTIIATAIPRITDEFSSLNDIGWYGSAYMLTTAAAQLVYGRIYKFYNMKWVFLLSIIIFETGSVICGAAPNSSSFIVGRAIAGLGSAGIFGGCLLIIIPMVPLHKRPMFQGLFGLVFGLASTMGPLVGGGLTGSVSWRWCFYINLPIGAFTLVFMVFFWNPPQRKAPPPVKAWEHVKRLDPLGTFFFIPAIVSLLLALQWGGSQYAWDDARIIVLFIVAVILGLAFVAVQHFMPKTATIPGRIMKQRSVFCSMIFTFFLAGSMLIMIYFLPIWFQTVKLVDPLKSGIYTLPLVLSLVVASLLGGIITQKIGYYVPNMIMSPCIMAIGEGLMTTFSQSTGSNRWIAYQFLGGFGLGLGMQTAGLAMQTVLPFEDISTGMALVFFSQQLGGAIFTSVGQTVLGNLLVEKLTGIAGIDPQQIAHVGATDLFKIVPPQDVYIITNAYNYALTRIFLVAMCLAFVALVAALCMEWRSIKKDKKQGGPLIGAAEKGAAGDRIEMSPVRKSAIAEAPAAQPSPVTGEGSTVAASTTGNPTTKRARLSRSISRLSESWRTRDRMSEDGGLVDDENASVASEHAPRLSGDRHSIESSQDWERDVMAHISRTQ